VIAGHFQQMRADRGEPVLGGHPLVEVEGFEQLEAGLWTVHHGRGDGVVEPHHGSVGEAFE
jgi:hypothetical protein